jgi:hypothetical protein
MMAYFATALAVNMGLCLFADISWAQSPTLPMEPTHISGQSVTPAYEGWFKNPDGSFSLLVGYYNRNQQAAVDIPIGLDNRIEPGGPDLGQPAHFLPGRQWGVFTIRVPADFGDKKLTWTINANGKTMQVPFSLNLLWEVEPFRDANGNTPPWVSFKKNGPFQNGPVAEAEVLTATAGDPLLLPVWVAEDEKLSPGARRPSSPAATLSWSRFRGPAEVLFSNLRPPVEQMANRDAPQGTPFQGKATTTVTFPEPGDYILRLQINDWSGEGGRGFQCCWTTAFVKVSVKSATGTR